jgi:4-amino-4-deoxy-L-arabinose transferase-like glycosyltransferase
MSGSEERARSRWAHAWEVVLLLAITALGLWFRWRYARDVSFFVDEYLTVRAAQRILAHGVPLLPSGNFYSHGLLLSYVEALVIGLGGTTAWLIRLPVVLLSTAAIPLTWWFGRRIGTAAAGLVAAVLLALAPEAILWGGRVRMYAPLQFFVLAATVIFYCWVVKERDRPLYRLLFVLAYWGALFSHAEAMLLLPIWGVWALVQRGWRWCLRPANLLAFALSGMSAVVEILLRRMGPPVQVRVAAGILEPLQRQYLGAALDWPGVHKALAPVFMTAPRLPLTILALGGAIALLLARALKLQPGTPHERRALLYLYALLLPTLGLLLFAVDPEWKSPRFTLMLLPHVFLIAGVLLAWLGRWPQAWIERHWIGGQSPLWSWAGATVVVALVAVISWSPASAAARESVPAYDWAFEYVQEHQQPGDVVITFLCPAAFFHLGRCDYLAIPTDFSGFATQKDGHWVSGWDEVPILDSASGLSQVLAKAPRAWFVVDEGRFGGRYDAEFQQAVWNRMDLVAANREMLVFLSSGSPPYKLEAAFGDAVRLLGYNLAPPGATTEVAHTMVVTFYWQAVAPVDKDYTVFVHLVDEAGQIKSQADGPPLEGRSPTSSWKPGEVMKDVHTLALGPEVPPGNYRLLVGFYAPEDGLRLPVTAGPTAGEDRVLVTQVTVR